MESAGSKSKVITGYWPGFILRPVKGLYSYSIQLVREPQTDYVGLGIADSYKGRFNIQFDNPKRL